MTGIFNIFFFAKLMRRFGEKRIFMGGMSVFAPCFMLMPVMSVCAKTWGVGIVVWSLIGVVFVMLVVMDLAYGKPLLKTEFEVYHVVIFVHHPTPCVFFFRIDIYVCYCFGTEQTVSWCYEWVITNDRVDFSCYWAGVVNFVVFVFGSTQYSGRLRCLSAYDYLVSSSSYTWDAITGTCLGGEGRLKGW